MGFPGSGYSLSREKRASSGIRMFSHPGGWIAAGRRPSARSVSHGLDGGRRSNPEKPFPFTNVAAFLPHHAQLLPALGVADVRQQSRPSVKSIFPAACVVLALGLTDCVAGWVVVPGGDGLQFTMQPAGADTIEAALKEMAASERVDALHAIVAHELLRNPTFQEELFSALEQGAPRELHDALESAGNMHNPRMVSLREPFKKAVLATATVRHIDSALAAYGLHISDVSFEKLELRRGLGVARFHCALWFIVAKLPNPHGN